MLKTLFPALLLVSIPIGAQTAKPDTESRPAAQKESEPKQEPKQDKKKEKKPSILDELAPQLGGGAGEDLRAEMARLFTEVEKNLIAIDDELAMAGAGEVELGAVRDSGIEKLLRSQKSKSNQVVSDIDRILEITEQLGGT